MAKSIEEQISAIQEKIKMYDNQISEITEKKKKESERLKKLTQQLEEREAKELLKLLKDIKSSSNINIEEIKGTLRDLYISENKENQSNTVNQ